MHEHALTRRALARSVVYRTLSDLYGYPDVENFQWIMERHWVSELRAALSELTDDDVESCLGPLVEALMREEPGIGIHMGREYTRLFITGLPNVVAPPHGSVYLDQGGGVWGASTSEVVRFYGQAGITLDEEAGEPADHVAFELEFMAILAEQESGAPGAERVRSEEVQMAFFARFLNSWMPGFCERIVQGSTLPFYRALALLTREFLKLEKDYLGIESKEE